MITKTNTEKMVALNCLKGEYSLNAIVFDATDLTIILDSIENIPQKQTLIFKEIYAYRVSLEHFRWEEYKNTGQTHELMYKVLESNYIKWIEQSGMGQFVNQKDVSHYLIYTTEHIVDIIMRNETPILLNGNPTIFNNK